MKNKIVIGYSTNLSKALQNEFNKELLASVGLSQEKNEVVIIPYENEGVLSLTESYNDIWESAESFKDAIFVFIHDDIHFKSKDWGKNLLALFNNNEVDIIGVAGADKIHRHGIWIRDKNSNFANSNIWGKLWHVRKGDAVLNDYTSSLKTCAELQPVVVLDGVFIAFNPDTCVKFNEDFDDGHFYDISFCVENFLQGKRIAVTESIQIIHDFEEVMNEAWERNKLQFCEKYRAQLPLSVSSPTKKR